MEKEAWRGFYRPAALARVYAMVGESDKSVDLLERLVRIPSVISGPILRLDPAWRPLYGNKRFQVLIGQKGGSVTGRPWPGRSIACINLKGCLFSAMPDVEVRIYSLRDPRQYEDQRAYWQGRSPEERLSAVEVLRRQYSKFSADSGYDGGERLRRVLRVVQ